MGTFSKPSTKMLAVVVAVAATIVGGLLLSRRISGAAYSGGGVPEGREFDAGWMTVRVPAGWEVESKIDGTGCPLAHVKVFHPDGAWVQFLLDAMCGSEWFDAKWRVDWREDRLVVTESPPPLNCPVGDIIKPCGAPWYEIFVEVHPREGRQGRFVGVQVGNAKRRLESDLPVLRAIIESARIKSEKFPPPWK
jgi:hypothetical protein